MRKELKAVICVVLSIWFFVMGFEIGSYHEKKEIMSSTVPSVITPSEPPTADNQYTASSMPSVTGAAVTDVTQSQPSATQPTTPTSNTQPTTEKKDDPSTMSKAQILGKVTEAINKLKSEPNFKANKTENTTINVVDCSAEKALSLVNGVIQRFAGEKIRTYNFVNGQSVALDENGKEVKDEGIVTPKDVIPPTKALFTLSEDGVKDAMAVKNGDGWVYTLKLVEEKTVMDNPIPNHNSKAIGYLNLMDIKVPGSTFTEANMHYPESIIIISVDGQGRATNIHYYLPMDGSGAAKFGPISGTATFEGSNDEVWEIYY